MKNIRNFSIIAHIDHGKSTLSDRLIQICGGLKKEEMIPQVLDSMDLERERGITIKAQNVTLNYKALNGNIYQLNLIDTPGHVDFSYEVSRSLSACEGAILLIDSRQGIEAQTIANYSIALKMQLKIIPVLNKIDLPFINISKIEQDFKNITSTDNTVSSIVQCSAKTGFGVTNVLESIVKNVPAPTGNSSAPLQALIIDSWFDNYMGVISLIRIKQGSIKKGDKIKIMSTNKNYIVSKLGVFTPKQTDRSILNCGEIGWIMCNIRDIYNVTVGDTITLSHQPSSYALPGFKKIKPKVYAGVFPTHSHEYSLFLSAMNKLRLNDSSLLYEIENSASLGSGLRCGFLGLLHMEIIRERLHREHKVDVIITYPTVIYEVLTTDKKTIYVDNPSKLPPVNKIADFREPVAECRIFVPSNYLGEIFALCIKRRGTRIAMLYHDTHQVELIYEIPMSELIFNFFDKLKSVSHGYASLDYHFKCFRSAEMVKIDILINGRKIDSLSRIVHKDRSLYYSHHSVKELQKLIPRQQFNISVQASINNNIIARSDIKQLRKDVSEKCYGGDISRKKKLLDKQKDGKKKMKKFGNMIIPKKIFSVILDQQIN